MDGLMGRGLERKKQNERLWGGLVEKRKERGDEKGVGTKEEKKEE